MVLKAYKAKYRKLPNLGDDMKDARAKRAKTTMKAMATRTDVATCSATRGWGLGIRRLITVSAYLA